MDKDRVAGTAKQTKGAVKETLGNLTGDAKLKAEGQADKMAGKTQNAVGGAKEYSREQAQHNKPPVSVAEYAVTSAAPRSSISTAAPSAQ